jgi:hypothetical protein
MKEEKEKKIRKGAARGERRGQRVGKRRDFFSVYYRSGR